jgi:hypothetical protein
LEAVEMKTTHKIDVTRSGNSNGMDWEADYTITFNHVPGRPEVRTLRNGDPGWPADPAELEFVSISPDAGDHGGFTDLAQKDLEEWASNWLDENYDKALAVVERDDETAREYAAELKLDG